MRRTRRGQSSGRPPIERDRHRRAFLHNAARTLAGATLARAGGYWPTAYAHASSNAPWPSLKRIGAGDLNVEYAELGPPNGLPVILLHGWPYDIHSFAEAAPLLAAQGCRVIVPYLRGFGGTFFRTPSVMRNGQQAALANDVLDLMDALQISRAVLAGFDWGARSANVVAALHPERCLALVSVSGYLIGSQQAAAVPLPPAAEHSWWYQFYFATERGRLGYADNRIAFNRLIWRLASPEWRFDDSTYAQTAASFNNPDHAAVVIHNYRWRLALADGESRFDNMERRLAQSPAIATPTITLEGDANGAPHTEQTSYAAKFTGRYVHRLIDKGVGHNLPQEAPRAFADAILQAITLAQAP